MLRCAASVGTNYRSACRTKSGADFIAKLSIVEEKVAADEAMYWMELLAELGFIRKGNIESLYQEANSLVAIVVTSLKTLRGSDAYQSKTQNLKS